MTTPSITDAVPEAKQMRVELVKGDNRAKLEAALANSGS
jgi:hypothetical protein